MEVKVSMSYLDDEKYSVKNISGNELVIELSTWLSAAKLTKISQVGICLIFAILP